MFQTYETRGKIAFLADQAEMMGEAFRQGDMEGAVAILTTLTNFAKLWLSEETGKPL